MSWIFPFRAARKLLTKSTPQKWSLDHCTDPIYHHKFTDVVRILAEWFEPFGGFKGKDVLEFGCGEGTVALGIALQHEINRILGVEVLNVCTSCGDLAQKQLGLAHVPDTLELRQISPTRNVADLGKFDFIYSWSVFEHVEQDLLSAKFHELAQCLKPDGVMFLQISPLYYSKFGSHLSPWIPVPWGHLSMQGEKFQKCLEEAPPTPPEIRAAWKVYIDDALDQTAERKILWNTFHTLNRATAPLLSRHAKQAGLKIVREHRTLNEDPIPDFLTDIYDEDILRTEQIVWLLQLE